MEFISLFSKTTKPAYTVWSGVRWLSKQIIGQWDWEAPVWLTWLSRQIRTAFRYLAADRRRLAAALLTVVLAGGGWYWYKARPKPHYVTYAATAPELTPWDDNGRRPPRPLQIDFDEPAAPLQQIEKKVTAGVSLSPALAGTWFWVSDRKLQFTPKDDWPVDGNYTVRFARNGLFSRQTTLEEYSAEFHSAPFTAKIGDSQFYQDPRDPALKKIVVNLEFSHPVDTERLEKLVSLSAAKEAAYLGLKPDSRQFTVVYDKFKLAASIHSVPLAMPRDDTRMTFRIDKGLRAARGGNETKDRLLTDVVIPGKGSLRFSDLQMTIVDNVRYEPEQVLLVRSSSPVTEKPLAGKVTAWVLPVRHPQQPKENKAPWEWTAADRVGGDILGKSEPLKLSYLPSETPGDVMHGFKFQAPVGRYVYAEVKEGVEGTGGYVSTKPFSAVFLVQPYPKALTFLGKGSLLSLSGEKKVGFLVRDVGHVQIEIGRVLPNQLQHLAPRMWDYTKPGLFDGITDKLVERFIVTRDYSDRPAGKPAWDSIDLTPYLQSKAGLNRGLFLLRILEARKPDVDQSDADGDSDDEEDRPRDTPYFRPAIEDNRLILLTDLGLIVKRNKDESRDVFVQSIRTGSPVEGVHINVLGRNGEAATSVTTDPAGHAQLAKFATNNREKNPETILIQKDNDFSFLPLQSNGRNLDVSRFDTGGAVNAKSAQELSSYLFSDRGIYRPGETVHLGVIVRTGDWKAGLTGLPVKVEINDSRGTVVLRSDLKLSATAFEEVTWTSAAGAPTGTYQALAFLVKDPNRQELLGSTSFRVQEFEPDRMKVRLDLSDKPVAGWLRPDDVKPIVNVLHLFGDPASGRRVEGELSLNTTLPHFTRYPDHRFQIAEFQNEPFHENLAPAVTDEKGNAGLKLDLSRFAGRAYRLNILVRAFEAEGGRNVAAQSSAIVSDAPWLAGVKPDGDLTFVQRNSARAANWVAVNQQLEPVAADNLTLDWIQRKYVSVLTEQGNKTYKYVSRLKEIPRDSRKISIPRGGVNIPLRTSEPGDFVFILRDAAGGEVNKLSYSVAGDANISRSLERDAELQIQLNKKEYSAGETIDVAIRAPYTGAGLITIERDKVYTQQWFHTTTTSSVQHIRLPGDFEGSGYVSVEFVRDPASDEIFLSPLSFGVAPFTGNLTARTEPLTLTAPREIRPGATLIMRVVPTAPARVVVLAVDEGILQVARYRNPDPLGYFFQKKMLEVDTTQILDLILPEFRKFLALAAPGGDADGGFARHLNPFQKKRKAPVAFWSGIVDVGPAGRDFRYQVPDYFNGKLRILAIAVSASRVGVQEAGTNVKGDFILTPNVPSMVAPGDEFIISTGVLDNVPGGKGPIRIEVQSSPELTAVGPLGLDLDLAGKKESAVEFRFRANAMPGSASLRFSARRGAANARMEESVSVRPSTAFRTQLTLGRTDNASATVPLTRDLFTQQRAVEAAISSLPLVWGRGIVAWLNEYPYLCTEQLASKGMAALLLTSRPEFGVVKSSGAQPLAATVSALASRQNDSGGLGLWASSPQTAEFPTIYAVHFLLEARDRGQRVSPELLAQLNDWMTRFASTPAPTLDAARLRAYAVYLLARQGLKPAAAISNVEQELSQRYTKDWPADLAAAYLASTYRLLQRNDDADRILNKVQWSQQKTTWTAFDYYDRTIHDAQLVYLEARHFPNRLNNIPRAVFEDIAKTAGNNNFSSLSAAYTLLALDSYAKAATGNLKLSINEIGKDGASRPLALSPGVMPKAELSANAARVEFRKDGALPAYYSLAESGFDRNPPKDPIQRGLEILHDFVDAAGNPVQRVRTGEEFFVRIRLRAIDRDTVSQLAVVDILPGGVETVLELRPPADSSAPAADPASRQAGSVQSLPIGIPEKSTWHPQHLDVRDDRVILYGYIGKETSTFVYRVRATNPGTFITPPAFAEGMYDRSVIAQSLPGRLEISKP